MPRKKPESTKQPKRAMYIICEGSPNHSEYAYIDGFLKNYNLKTPSLNIISSKKNNPLGLLEEISRHRKTNDDILWIVFDYDQPVELPEAIKKAKEQKINIALSTISFEIWIYLHFDYTTRQFKKSSEVISEIKRKFQYDYRKDNLKIFSELGNRLEKAQGNSELLRKDRIINCMGLAKYNWNPYTNFDQILLAIENFIQEERMGIINNIPYDLPY